MALRKRGELTLWFSEEAVNDWHSPAGLKPGGQRIYSDLAIETGLTIRSVYHLGLKQTEGFLRSVSALLRLDILIPDHSTLSRRSKQLDRIRPCPTVADCPVRILIDSTGLKIHNGAQPIAETTSRRTWRKLHLAVDAGAGGILASEVTTHRAADSTQVRGLLSQQPATSA